MARPRSTKAPRPSRQDHVMHGPVGTAYREMAALFPGQPVLARVAVSELGHAGDVVLDVAVLRPDMSIELAIQIDRTDAEIAATRRALEGRPVVAVSADALHDDPVSALHAPVQRTLEGGDEARDGSEGLGGEAMEDVLHETDRHPRSGLQELDRRLGPLEPGELVVLGGLTGMGKSSLLRHLAVENAVRRGIPTLYVTLEVSHERAAMDMALAELRLDGASLRTRGASPEERARLEEVLGRLRDAPLTLASRADMTPDALEGIVRCHAVGSEAVRLVLVDCLELVTGEGPDVLMRCKRLARRTGSSVVVITNRLSATNVRRPDGRPALPDLGDLGLHADKVVLLHRERVYEMRGDNAYVTELYLAKNRTGPKGLATVAYFEESRSFSDLEVTYDVPVA